MKNEVRSFANNLTVPALGLGTWEMGGRSEPDTSENGRWIAVIKKAIDSGFRHIDTAEKYGDGNTEHIVGKAIQDFPRNELFITSKISSSHFRYHDVFRSLDSSLERLQTGYLDLYLLHEPPDGIPLEETMQAMDELVDKGLIRMAGVSNFQVPDLEEAMKHANTPVVTNQIEYNLVTRDRGKLTTNMEKEIIPWCLEHGVVISAWRPLAKGALAKEPHPAVRKVAEKYGKTPAQVAIRWLLDKKGFITLVKASSENHLNEDLGALGWKLEDEDMTLLDDLSSDQD